MVSYRELEYPLTEEQKAVREAARVFATEQVAPLAVEADGSDEFSVELHQRMVESGLLAYFVPEEYGGNGLQATNISLIREQLAKVSPASDEIFASQGIAVQPLVMWGTEEQKNKYLPGFLDGSNLFAFCLTEPAAGSDVAGLQTTAVEDGDEFVINGEKRFIFAPERANLFFIFAKTEPDLGKRGITAFLAEKPDHGISFSDYHLLKTAPHSEVHFRDMRIPASSMIGERGAGIKVALGNLDRLRASVGAAAIGMADAAIDDAVEHVRSRKAFGGVLADQQAVRFMLASAVAELDAARLLVYAAAANADGDQTNLSSTAAKAKYVATETAQRAIDTALQVHGGSGLARGSVTERMFKAVRATRIYEGSSEIMQLVIARSLFPERRR